MKPETICTSSKTKLATIADEKRELYEPNTKEYLPYIGLEHIEQGTLKLNGVGVSSETQSTKKKFHSGDILFGSLRPYFRKVVRPKFSGVCSTDITVIRAKNDTDQGFLFYLVASEPFIHLATNISIGTRMPRANWKVLSQSDWSIPPASARHKIAAILSAYDDLIENNTRRIKILEEMAKTIYNEWFVMFRFPGHENVKMVDSELGLIPEGWEPVKVADIIRRLSPGKLYDQRTVSPTGSVPVLDQGRSGIIGYHDDEPGVQASEETSVIVFANHTCYQRLIQYPYSSIQNVIPFIPKQEIYRNIFWLHWATKDLIEFNDYKGHWPEFMAKQLILPTSDICEEFGQLVKPMVAMKYRLEKKNQNICLTRDLLLPKLISGELSVEHLEIDKEGLTHE